MSGSPSGSDAGRNWLRPIRTDCRHYQGDRPCQPHKDQGVTCDDCPHYDPVQTRILMLKLGALGDVVRTTALIAPLRKAYPGVHLTWLAGSSSVPYLSAVPGIDRVLTLDTISIEILRSERFDVIACLDLSDEATALAANLEAGMSLGFGRRASGEVHAFDERGERVVAMSHWDDLKRANQDTYQDLMADVLGLTRRPYPIPKPDLSKAQEQIEERFGAFLRASAHKPLVGLNLGGGGRWRKKVWTAEGFANLSDRIRSNLGGAPILLYGSDEREKAGEILSIPAVPPLDTGGDLSVLEFTALLGRCGVVVTGDSLGLHLALAMECRVVCLVGPTSAAELELYGTGKILQGSVDCLGCYLTTCDLDPDCMNTISAEQILSEIQRQLDAE